MDGTTFEEKQKKIMEKREKEKGVKEEREKTEDANIKDKIVSFFEGNKESIINGTLDSFMKELNNESLPPYKVDHELDTSLYFGCSRNDYNVFLENMIKDELKRITKAIGDFKVITSILSKENGYWSCGVWVPTGGCHSVMIISISLDF